MNGGIYYEGLWIPKREAKRFAEYPTFEGRLDIDARKNMRATKYCRSRQRALDIGAHIGSVTRMLAGRFKAVAAFEAVPDTFRFLEKNAQGLDNVEIYNLAASDQPGELYFEFLERHSQLSHAIEEGERLHFADEGKDKARIVGPIEARPIDSFGYDDVTFIKIDVEGKELDVVKGLKETIRRCRPVILIEQANNDVDLHGGVKNEASAYLRELGMVMESNFHAKNDRVFRYPD